MSRSKVIRMCVLALLTASVCIFATSGEFAGAATKPVKGGSLVFLSQVEARLYDPAKMSGGTIDGQFGELVYDQLLYFDNKSPKPRPGIALSATQTANSTVWTIKLRPDVKFTDGTPLDASAVEAHLLRIKNPATGSAAQSNAAEIASTKVIDPQTLQVTLGAADSTWDQTLGRQLGNVPSPTAVAKYGSAYGTSADKTVGAGPFMLKSWVPGADHTFERNPGYWDAPKPYLDSLTIRVVTDAQTRANTFTTGAADLSEVLTPHPSLPTLMKSYPYINMKSAYLSYAIRTDSGPTADLRVRQALVYGVNTAAVAQRAAPGAKLQTTWNAPGTPYYVPVKLPKYNLTKAKNAIASYLKDTGQTSVEVPIYTSDTQSEIGQAYQQEWSKIPGLNVKLVVEAATQSATVRNAGRQYTGLVTTSATFTPRLITPILSSTSNRNTSYLNDPAIDASLKTMAASADVAGQKAELTKIMQQVNKDLPYVPQWPAPLTWFYQKPVHGLQLLESTAILFQNVWKSKS
jgi:peptide/nickel transport system substrate-binding protein